MRRILLALTIVAAVGGIAYASTTYTFINSNGGASISGENSTKKAGLRCLAMTEGTGQGGNYWSCASGEDCWHGGGGSPSGQQHYTVSNCRDDARDPTFRLCDIYRNGQLRWSMKYKLGYWAVSYWDLLTNSLAGTCDVPHNKILFN